jgi:hypothetical protein
MDGREFFRLGIGVGSPMCAGQYNEVRNGEPGARPAV